MRAKERELSQMPDWLLNDVGLPRAALPRGRRWFADLLVGHAPASLARDWGWHPNWRRE
jgi:hypothetical protein